MEPWTKRELANCFELVRAPVRIQARDYRSAGTYPIVDQGQELIGGWTDRSDGLVVDLPLVVFGDHTRVLKFVDFPFVRGADGTHLLKPAAGIDARFLYYGCLSIDLPSRGYNRHLSLLREQSIRAPGEPEQRTIANCLRVVEDFFTAARRTTEALTQLKRTTMRELFTRGLRGEGPQALDFGNAPGSWRVAALQQVAKVQTGAAKGRKFADGDAIEVPYLRVANVQDGHLDLREMKTLRIRSTETERYRLRDGDVVLTEGGDFDKLGRGFIWRGELPLCIHQNHVFAVRVDRTVLDPRFFAYLAQSPYGKAYFLHVAHKTTNLACINSHKLKAFPVLVPSLDEQREIVDILEAVDRKAEVHKRKRAVLDDLFKSLLHKLMTGEIRVSDLDLSALEQTMAAQVST